MSSTRWLVPLLAAALGTAALGTAPASRAGDVRPAEEGRGPLARPMLHGKLELSLANAIAMGLENNLGVEVARYDPYIADREHTAAWGAFDPEAFSEFGYSSIKEPNAFSVNIGVNLSVNRSTDGFGGLRGMLPLLGTRYEFRFDSSRATTNSAVQRLSPELRSSFDWSVTQPLMRNLIWNEPWTAVKVTGVQSEAAWAEFVRVVMDTVSQIERAYWNVVAADDSVRVATKSLETAEALLGQTETQYEVGVVSKVEVTEAEAGVAARRLQLIEAENAYDNLQDVLINRVLGEGLRADSTLTIVTTDRPEEYIPYEIDVQRAVDKAFSHRPELDVLDRQIETAKLNLKLAKHQRLPQVDAVVSYGNRGLSGDENEDLSPVFATGDTETGNYGDTLDDFLTPDAADQFTARLVFSFPFPNTTARARYSQRDLELRRTRSERTRLEQNIILEVRNAARDLESAQERIEASESQRVAAEEQLRAEEIRLEYGESTPFDVLLREEDLVEAEAQKIEALRDYRINTTQLDRAQGTILETRQIRIEEVSRLR